MISGYQYGCTTILLQEAEGVTVTSPYCLRTDNKTGKKNWKIKKNGNTLYNLI